MNLMSRREYLRAIHPRYQRAGTREKGGILDEFRRICGYHRKYAIRLLHQPRSRSRSRPRRVRGVSYPARTIEILAAIWEAAGYP